MKLFRWPFSPSWFQARSFLQMIGCTVFRQSGHAFVLKKFFENIYASPRFCGRGIFSEKPDFGKQWKNTVPGAAKIYPHFVGFLAWKSGERKELRQKKQIAGNTEVLLTADNLQQYVKKIEVDRRKITHAEFLL